MVENQADFLFHHRAIENGKEIARPQRPFVPGTDVSNWGWGALGAAIVWGLTFARARFLWFPLHPLAFLMAGSFPIAKLWTSFLIGWATKSLVLRFGGQDTAQRLRPFMLGLILGNAAAMVLWMLAGFFLGSQIPYWPA